MPSSLARRAAILAIVALAALPPGCVTSPEEAGPNHRLGQDAFVFFTSPIQIPSMAFRDAIYFEESPWVSGFMFPLTFPLYMLEHSVLTVFSALDMFAYPYHAWNKSVPLDMYDTTWFPMRVSKDYRLASSEGTFALIVVAGTIAVSLLVSSLAP